MDELLKKKELAAALKVTVKTIGEWMKDTTFPIAVKKPLRFILKDVIKWCNQRSKRGKK